MKIKIFLRFLCFLTILFVFLAARFVFGNYNSSTTASSGCAGGDTALLQGCDLPLATCTYTCNKWGDCTTANIQTCIDVITTPAGAVCSNPLAAALTKSCVHCNYTCNKWSGCNTDGKETCLEITHTPIGAECSNAKPATLAKSCVYVAPLVTCAYTCNKWGDCTATNIQTCVDVITTPAGAVCSNPLAAALTKSCATPCVYTYGLWSTTCDAAGYRTRPYTAAPAGCSKDVAPVVKESCNKILCTSYIYGEWSTCSDSGVQTRKIISKNPVDCTDTSSAVSQQKCAYTASAAPCVFYTYSEWSGCDSTGKQKRKIISSLPIGCAGGLNPVLEQNCGNKVSCVYVYGGWAECQPDGTQTRKIASLSPKGCLQDINSILKQKCNYLVPKKKSKVPCVYSYGLWGACILGKQTRTVASQSPADCSKTIVPELSRDCDKSSLSDVPAPVPESMLEAPPENASNYNDRTGLRWQQYYFGFANCQDANVCAGTADYDNDGLSNNEEYRFGTDPKKLDTDSDGLNDADEIQNNRNPLLANSTSTSDKINYESPKEKGQELSQVYEVEDVSYNADKKELKITGHALPNIYVTIYVYSEEPIILTVKTDSEGNWSYIVDKPEIGSHEVYVVVNDNSGKVVAKSAPLLFVQTAEAATVNYPASQKAMAPAKTRLHEGYFIFFGTGIGGLILALAAIGLARNMGGQKKE